LAHRHFWKNVIDQVRRTLRHSSPAAARTDGPALTGERDEPIEPARAAVKAREPAGEKATTQERSKLFLDESRQAVPFVDATRLGAERLEVIAHDLVQRALCRRLRPVPLGWAIHAPDVANDAPQELDRDLLGSRPRDDER
jgi:hypothetical protein